MVKITLNNTVTKLKEKSKAKNTQDKYDGDWLLFEDYCLKEHKCKPLDVDDLRSAYALTANYMDYLYQNPEARKRKGSSKKPGRIHLNNNPYSLSPYKASTIQRILASISYKYRLNGFKFDRKDPDISETISAIVRDEKEIRSAQAKEILKKDIIKIVDSIPNSENLRDIRDKALILVGFFSFCRRSELLGIKYENLTFSEEGIEVWIPYSKTDQTGEGRPIFLPKTRDNYCPVQALKHWLEVSQIALGPLFFKINKANRPQKTSLNKKTHKKIVLTETRFVIMLKKRALEAGLDNCDKISGHSLRIGAITQARINGVPTHEIMAQSGHKTTQMIDRYTKLSNIRETSAAKKI